jgi:hypothetical protein
VNYLNLKLFCIEKQESYFGKKGILLNMDSEHSTLPNLEDVDLEEIDDRIEILKQSLDELSESKSLVLQYKIVI